MASPAPVRPGGADPTPAAEIPTQPAATPKPPAGQPTAVPAEVPVTAENTEPAPKPTGLSKVVLKAGSKVTFTKPGTNAPGQGNHFDLVSDYEIGVKKVSSESYNGHVGFTPEGDVTFEEFEGERPENSEMIYVYTAENPNLMEIS